MTTETEQPAAGAPDAKAQLQAAYERLKAEVEAIDEAARPLVEAGKKLTAQIEPLLAQRREISQQLKQYRGKDYAEKKKLLGGLAATLGGKVLKAAPGEFTS